jgi:hypothetical protein
MAFKAGDIVARLTGARHRRKAGSDADQRDAPLGGLKVAGAARLTERVAGARVHGPDLVEKLIGDAHALHAVVGRVIVRAVEEIEAQALEIEHDLRRPNFPVAPVLNLGPALEILHAEDGLLEVDHRGVGPADDIHHRLEARVAVVLMHRNAAIDDGVAGRGQGPHGIRPRDGLTGGGLGQKRNRKRGGEAGKRAAGAPREHGRRERTHGVIHGQTTLSG